MVYIKVHQIKLAKNLKRSIAYILDKNKVLVPMKDKTADDFSLVVKDGQLMKKITSGHLITDEANAASEFIMTKLLADQRQGREEGSDLKSGKGVLAHHIIQSFSPEDNLTPEEIHEIGRKTVLELTGSDHGMVMATHVDQKHIHNHIIFNTTSSVDLKKFRWQKGTRRSLEKISDRHADLASAKLIDKQPLLNHTSYQAYRRKNNFKLELKQRLEFLIRNSSNLDDFKAKAAVLKVHTDFSGKEPKYRLLDPIDGKLQQRNTRGNTLSKRGRYSAEGIEKWTAKNGQVPRLDEMAGLYAAYQKEKAEDFEIKLKIEPWQVSEETKTGIYLDMDYGLRNHGKIKIPARQVDKMEDGSYAIFIKRSDFFYFINPDKSENNRFLKGPTLIKQLAYNSGEYVLTKSPHISKLDNLIKEFEFLSKHGVTNYQQFEALSDRFIEQLDEAESTLDRLDNRLSRLNKVAAALKDYHSPTPEDRAAAQGILESLHINLATQPEQIEKQIIEVTVERDGLKEKLDQITADFSLAQQIKDNVKARDQEQSQELKSNPERGDAIR